MALSGCSSGTVMDSSGGDGGPNDTSDSSVKNDSGVMLDATPGNESPVASFTANVNELAVTVDGSASSDADGAIASYAWDFGDGDTATGATPGVHTYATAGSKAITLTVTDDLGATGTSTQTAIVAVGVTNQSPTASFTVSASNLVVTVNGSASSDPDGTIASYAWNFGDGGTATGATPGVHTYGSAGTKSITLTVTDNVGATGMITKTITVSTAPPPSVGPGAHLPITYTLGDITGTKYFVATNGNNSAAGTEQAPFASLATAIGKVSSGQSATIVVRGGEYAEGNFTIPAGRTLRVIAYPNETPIFRGSQKFASGWTTEGGLAWHSYADQPATDAAGISFSQGENLNSMVGIYPDQAWIGTAQIQQVLTKGEVAANKFWVDAPNNRLYLTTGDAAKANIEASDKNQFMKVSGANCTLEGLRITRYSNTADDYGVIRVENSGKNLTIRNVEIIDPAFQTIAFAGSEDSIMDGVTMTHVTIDGPNWMGVDLNYVDNANIDAVKFVGANRWQEFKNSPQTGAVKTSRCRHVKITNSQITDNRSQALWFDESNVDMEVAGCFIDNNEGTGVFFEISDDLLLINNFIRSTGDYRAVKIAGSSGVKIVNNTIIGGADPIGVYTDNRSKPGCADPAQPQCADTWSSNRRSAATRPATLDWMPRLDLMLNNIVAYPSTSGYCGAKAALCVTSTNESASCPIQTIIHKAEPGRGIPETRMDGNVYANGSGSAVRVSSGNYATAAAWSTGAAGAPISIAGLDAHSKTGDSLVNADGSPTSALNHSDAVALPADADINQYLPAGTKHFGWLK